MDSAGDIILYITRKAFLVCMKEARDDGENLAVARGQYLQNPIDFELIVPDKKLPVVEQGAGNVDFGVGHSDIWMDRLFGRKP